MYLNNLLTLTLKYTINILKYINITKYYFLKVILRETEKT